MSECVALRLDLDENLAGFSNWLHGQGITHRITEQSGQQVIWVPSQALAETVQLAYQKHQHLEVEVRSLPNNASRPLAAVMFTWLKLKPVTFVAIICCALGGAVVAWASVNWLMLLSFQPFDLVNQRPVFGSFADAISAAEYWRMFTPLFLHFGVLHLVFNSLWLWELGGAVERWQGSGRLLMLIITIGLFSNYSQYLYHADVLFGGMSGVIYGLVGYCWIWQRLVPSEPLNVSNTLFWILVGFMLVMVTGVFSILGFGDIANAAHTSGLVAGLFIGAVFAWQRRIQLRS